MPCPGNQLVAQQHRRLLLDVELFVGIDTEQSSRSASSTSQIDLVERQFVSAEFQSHSTSRSKCRDPITVYYLWELPAGYVAALQHLEVTWEA